MARTEYPTKTLTNATVGTIVIEPLTPEHKKRAFDSLADRGIVVLPGQLNAASVELGIEFALNVVKSWTKTEGGDATAVEKRDFLNRYDSLRETILAKAGKLNAEWNVGVELEEKNS